MNLADRQLVGWLTLAEGAVSERVNLGGEWVN